MFGEVASLSFVAAPISLRCPYLRPGRRPPFGPGQATSGATGRLASGIVEDLALSVATTASISL